MSNSDRKGLTRRQTLMTLSALSLSPRAAFAAPGDTISAAMRAAVAGGTIPGIVVMAADRNGVIYHGAFGLFDIASKRAMREDDIFRIASMTKAITSTAAMQLIEQGRFTLDDPVQKYLPEFANLKMFTSFNPNTGAYTVRPVSKAVTVRHLFTHTAGFEYNFDSPIVRDFKPRKGDNFAIGPTLFEPGTQWHYGTNVDQLGRLVETISGQKLEAYFHDHIFTPLGMTDTFYNVPANKQARLVPLNHRPPTGPIVADPMPPDPLVPMPIGGGGLASTAADYIRFTRTILGDGALDGVRVLKPESVAAMAQNQIGSLGVPQMRTAMPERSNDFTFVNDGRDKWGLGFLITAEGVAGKRSAGSLSWGGIDNTYYWIDRMRGLTGVILMQFLPFADPQALDAYDAFERGVYAMAKI